MLISNALLAISIQSAGKNTVVLAEGAFFLLI